MALSKDGTRAEGGDVEVTTSRRGDLFDPVCPTRGLLDRIGTKWVVMVVTVLHQASPSEVRFAELRRRMPGVSQKMLSQTLQGLVADGLASRRVEPTVPPAVHYGLTELGTSLSQPLAGLRAWAEDHMAAVDDHRSSATETRKAHQADNRV